MQIILRGVASLGIILLLFHGSAVRGQTTNADFIHGWERYDNDDWSGAITNFSKSIAASYDLYNSYSYRAYAKSMLNDSAGALADCGEAIKIYPAGGHFWRARIYLNLTNVNSALVDYVTALRSNPQASDTNLASDISYALGERTTVCVQADDLAGAISNLNVQIWLRPKASFLYVRRAQFKLFQGHYGAAIADADMALKYNRGQYFARVVRAWARLALNDVSGAKEDYDKINAWLDERLTDAKSDAKFWQEGLQLNEILFCLIKGETVEASEKSQEWFETVKATDDSGMKVYREHWQKLIKTIIAKAEVKKP